ncbi:regucalcin-like [Topomyia yanbarensis]|uniref:regucalcin-like n=1 Tax=Topomyia yanbarensis TaxID=2498891 RepID=UPI00273CCB27|nr:regucalcin-like [Topomyia yanbarensis]
MTGYRVEVLSGPLLQLGEAPHWDVARQSLYYVCILSGSLHRYDIQENRTYSASIPGITHSSFIIPVKERPEEFVVGSRTRIILVKWDGVSASAAELETLEDLGDTGEEQQFNDGKADPQGRLYAGTMLSETAPNPSGMGNSKLYRFDADTGKLVELKSGVHVSNGLAWHGTTNKFYYIDSFAFDIKEYDTDGQGNISNERVLIKLKSDESATEFIADGMTSDTDGNLYVAVFAASMVLKVNPITAIVDQEIILPVAQVTSVAFGGPDLDILFVTTAANELAGPQLENAGAVFKITGLGVKGRPMNEVQLK